MGMKLSKLGLRLIEKLISDKLEFPLFYSFNKSEGKKKLLKYKNNTDVRFKI